MGRQPISLREYGIEPSPEFLLVLYCARTAPDSELQASLAGLAKQITDWDYVFHFAEEQGVLLFLLHNLYQTVRVPLPQTLLTSVRRRYSSRSQSLRARLREITSLVAANGIRAISYKGPTLATIVYPQCNLRVSSDLDLLVHARDYRNASKVLLDQGYLVSEDCGYKCHLWHPIKRTDIDLHRALAPRWYQFRFNFDHAWGRAMRLAMPDGSAVQTFGLEDLVIVLCVDLVKDVAQPWNFRLLKITDIAELLKNAERINWDALINSAKSMGLCHITLFGLLLTDCIYPLGLPIDIHEQMRLYSPRLCKLLDVTMRLMLNSKSSLAAQIPTFLHEARTVLILQDHFWNRLCVIALYVARPVMLSLKYGSAAVASVFAATSWIKERARPKPADLRN
jgi:Uncharacterised nucleotidyltransferase